MMRIESVTLRNFRCHESLTIESREKSIIHVVGFNRSGKSTVLDAIAYAQTGQCRGVDAAGRGIQGLFREGAKPEDGFGVTLDTTAGRIARADAGPKSDIQKQIDGIIRVPSRHILFCLYHDALLSMRRKDMGDALAELFEPELTVQGLLASLPSTAHRDMVLATLPRRSDDSLMASDIALAQAALVNSRRDLGRVKRTGEPQAPTPPEGLGGMSHNDASDLLGGLREKVAALRDELQALEVGRQHDPAAVEAEIADLEAKRDAVVKDPGFKDKSEYQSLRSKAEHELKDLAEQEDVLRDAFRLAQHRYQDRATEAKRLREFVADVPDSGHKCTGCGRKHTDKTVSWWKKHIAKAEGSGKLADQVAALGQECEKLQSEADAQERILAEFLAQNRERRSELHDSLANMDKKWAGQEAREERFQGYVSRLGALYRIRKELREDTKTEPKINTLRRRISEGEAKIEALSGYMGALREYEQSLNRWIKATSSHTLYDECIKALGPDGYVGAATNEACSGMLAAVNHFLGQYDMDLDLGDGFQLSINGRAPELMSASEGLRVGIALQTAVALATGYGVVGCDNLDWLDKPSLGRFWEWVLPFVEQAGAQIWMFQTVKTEGLPAALDDGILRRVVLP